MPNMAIVRNKCRHNLEPGNWYTPKFVADVMDLDSSDFKEITELLGKVAEFEVNGNSRGENIRFLSIKEPRKYKRLTPEEREQRRLEREKKAAEPKVLRVQYTKCVRFLIETRQRFYYEDLNYNSLYAIYLGKSLEQVLTDHEYFDRCLKNALHTRICWDLHHIAQTNDTAEKKYILKSNETTKSFRASEEQARMIRNTLRDSGQDFGKRKNEWEYREAINKINQALGTSTFVCTAFKIKFLSNFLHRELYTTEIARSKVLRTLSEYIKKEIEKIDKRPIRLRCREIYTEWEAKHITPYLVEDEILKEA